MNSKLLKIPFLASKVSLRHPLFKNLSFNWSQNAIYLALSFFFLSQLFTSCSNNPLDIDVSKVQVPEVKISRFEQDVFNSNQLTAQQLKTQLEKKYGSFYLGFQSVINTVYPDSSTLFNLDQFRRETIMQAAFRSAQQVYPNLQELEQEITLIHKYFKHYFPQRQLPKVVSYTSGFNFKQFPVDTTIGISLDMYLGADSRFYKMIQFPRYQTLNMTPQNVPIDYVLGWMMTEFPRNAEKKDLLNEMVYNGKLLYLLDALMPDKADTLKIAYSGKQLSWCKQNEFNMWAYFVQKKTLYETNPAEIIKFTGEGPFTAAFNKESPSRVGNYIGWMIVRNYMKRQPKTTLEDLMAQKDAQKLLNQSHYKPNKF